MLPWKKSRTRLGRWLDDNGKSEKWLMEESGINKNTVTAVCNDIEYRPRNPTRSTIIKALRQVDPSISASDFW